MAAEPDKSARSWPGRLVFPLFRVVLGILFLSVWASNLDKGLYGSDRYAALINGYVEDGDAPGFWKDFMGFIADQSAVTSKLQLALEIVLGILLVLGLGTRAAGLVAGVFLTALWVSEIGVPDEWIWSLVFPALVAFAVAAAPSAKQFGLDSLWARSSVRPRGFAFPSRG